MSRRSAVAVIGLGAMGLPIAKNLVAAGIKTEVWNRSSAAAIASGALVVPTLQEIDAKVVLTVLPDMPQVREVLKSGLQEALKNGDILVVMGTVSPPEMQRLAEELTPAGIRLLDAPMSGGVAGAQNATMSIMVGGDESTANEVAPIFKKIGKSVILLGPLGAGQLTKASNQIIVAVTLAAICEAVALAKRSGLDPEKVFEILSGGFAASEVMKQKRTSIINNDFTASGKAKFLVKDLIFALEAGESAEAHLPFTELALKIYSDVIKNGNGDLDIVAVMEEFERNQRF